MRQKNKFETVQRSIPVLMGFFFALFGCAPTQAAKIRDMDPITLGVSGVQYRPTKNIGLNLNTLNNNTAFGIKNKAYENGQELLDKEVSRKGRDDFFDVLYFPFDTSAFFVGLGVSQRRSIITFNEGLAGGVEGNMPVTFFEHSYAVGVPIGYDWIWENGFTFYVNFGPYFYVKKTREFSAGENGSGVDETKRDKTIDHIYTLHLDDRKSYKAGTLLFGFSF